MDAPQPAPRAAAPSLFPWILVVVLLIGGGAYVYRDQFAPRSEPEPVAASVDPQRLTGAGVLRRIHDLNNLETIAFRIETVVPQEKAGTWWKLWQDKQQALFIADGIVTAGINLNALTDADVRVSTDGKTVQIQLPPPEILSVNLLSTKTYDYETGVFGLVNLDHELMEQAQQDARVKLKASACASDILRLAAANGEQAVRNLFAMLDVAVVVDGRMATESCEAMATP